MASMRDIQQRITNVSSTAQIIKAMDSIASSKLHKARAQLVGARPIYDGLLETVKRLSRFDEVQDHPYYEKRKVKQSLYIVLSSNQGFAGGYNAGVLNKALQHMKGKNEQILVVGRKGQSFFNKHRKNIIRTVNDMAESQVYYGTEAMAARIDIDYRDGKFDEVFLVHTRFENVLNYTPMVTKLLPLEYEPVALPPVDALHSPDLHTVLDNTVPLFLHMSLFQAFSDSHTSEQAARMVTMNAAGKNAEELIDDLYTQYNRERQAAITQEISEITGGSTYNK